MTKNQKAIENLEKEIKILSEKIDYLKKVISEKEVILQERKNREERYQSQVKKGDS